ncbi:MAG: stage II sporulation protein M [Nanoarchaeota archaeon]|nr:stage II sporulation protein M [Nanoarchaeota archaeon]
MVLESVTNPLAAESKPWVMVIVGFCYNSVALGLSWWIFASYASLIMVFLTTLATIPLIYGTIKLEEKKDENLESELSLLKEHSKAIWVLSFLFLGALISVVFWYLVLPGTATSALFGAQQETINNINSNVTGNAVLPGALLRIFINNLGVMFFCILFAIIYGFGAIFVLIWNASVIGVYIGNLINNQLATHLGTTGAAKVWGGVSSVFSGFHKVFWHGSAEVIAYIIAGLAGGILSISIVRHSFETDKFRRIIIDTSNLIFIALALLVIAAIIEVFISPLL